MNDDSLSQYFQEVGRHPVLSRAEELRLARRLASGDESAKRRLVESNLRLVVVIARRYRNLGLDDLDLIQEGNLGLMTAVKRYEPRPDVKFSTFASWWIRRAILAGLSANSRLIRLPARLATHAGKVGRAEQELTQRLGRTPTTAEIALAAGIEEALVERLRSARRPIVSLSDRVGEDEAVTYADVIRDDEQRDPAVAIGEAEEKETINVALAALGERSRRVLELRYGTDGADPRTLDEVADQLGVSRDRARKLEARALRALSTHPQLTLERAA